MNPFHSILPKEPQFEMPSDSTLNDIKDIFKKFLKDEEVYTYACLAFYISELKSHGSKEKAEECIKSLAENVRQIADMNAIFEAKKKEKKNEY